MVLTLNKITEHKFEERDHFYFVTFSDGNTRWMKKQQLIREYPRQFLDLLEEYDAVIRKKEQAKKQEQEEKAN